MLPSWKKSWPSLKPNGLHKKTALGKAESDQYRLERQLNEKDLRIKELADRLGRAEEERARYREELKAYQNALDERSAQFAEAQLHLAKKVRESALLELRVEELTEQINAADSQKGEIENRHAEVQNLLQGFTDEKNQLKAELSRLELERNNEKDRFQQIEEQLKTATQRIKSLELLQERHQQLQAMVSNFGSMLGITSTPTEAVPQQTTEPLQFGSFSEAETTKEDSRPYRNLFDMPKSASNSKQDLFE